MPKIKILIVEDDAIIAHDIRQCLEALDYQVTSNVYSAEDAYASIENDPPHLIILDINLGKGLDGISIGEKLRDHYNIPFVYLTAFGGNQIIERAKQTQPMGYLIKPFKEKDLYAAIEVALYNYSRGLGAAKMNFQNALKNEFTPKEIELIMDIYEGKTNKQLVEKHYISLNTVKTHILRIYEKLEVHSRSEAMAVLHKKLNNRMIA